MRLQSNWWVWLLRGLSLLLLGLFALVLPSLTVRVFTVGVAIYFAVVGVLNVISSLGGVGRAAVWFLTLVLGAVEIGGGVYALKHPGLSVSTLILVVGLVLVVRGIVELIAAFAEAYDSRGRAMTAVMGVLALAAGIAVWLYPANGLAFTWLVGLYGLVGGSFLVAQSIEPRVV